MGTATLNDIRAVAASVVDPEIPVLTIDDLGILRGVRVDDGKVVVTITPTYSGCPAMLQIEEDVIRALHDAGYEDVRVETLFKPAWTTAWMSESGRSKLAAFGIAPPTNPADVVCPQCQAGEPRTVAQFGSTACKAFMVCSACGEPFDYFKRH